jgi:hypothetical protein
MSVAAKVQSKSAQKNVTVSHKKNKINKTVHKTSVTRQRQMSEKDITECVRLIDKVAQSDKVLQTDMRITATNNSKIAEHLKKSADAQVFASDDPAAIAHLTGKSANLPIVKATPIPAALVAPKPITAKLAPSPAFKPTTATLVAPSQALTPATKRPHHTQVFASDDPKVLANLMGKTTALPVTPTTTKFATTLPVTKVYKPIKPTAAHPHPHIELFAPNPLVDLNHLEGKSANLETTVPVDKSTTTQKSKKSTHKSKSPSSSAVTTDTKAKTKKQHS